MYTLQFSRVFEEQEGLAESKDCVFVALTLADGRHYELYLTTIARLQQDSAEDLRTRGYYLDENMVLVDEVSRPRVETIVESIVKTNKLELLREKAGR